MKVNPNQEKIEFYGFLLPKEGIEFPVTEQRFWNVFQKGINIDGHFIRQEDLDAFFTKYNVTYDLKQPMDLFLKQRIFTASNVIHRFQIEHLSGASADELKTFLSSLDFRFSKPLERFEFLAQIYDQIKPNFDLGKLAYECCSDYFGPEDYINFISSFKSFDERFSWFGLTFIILNRL